MGSRPSKLDADQQAIVDASIAMLRTRYREIQAVKYRTRPRSTRAKVREFLEAGGPQRVADYKTFRRAEYSRAEALEKLGYVDVP